MSRREERIAVGIDAGGTSIRILVARRSGEAPGTPFLLRARHDGLPEPLGNPALLPGVNGEEVVSVCAGISKISRAGVAEQWQKALAGMFPNARREVVADYVIAHTGATGGAGITCVAGTGAVVYGENGAGAAVRVGGRGWEFGDEGSGAWLTLDLVRRTLRALDGIGKASPLTERVIALLGTRDAAVLAERARQRMSHEGRGFLVPFAARWAKDDLREAKDIFVGAAGWLAFQVKSAAAQLGYTADEAFPVAIVGGMWNVGDPLVQPFRDVLPRWYPRAEVVPPRAEPMVGALKRAFDLQDIDVG